VADTAVEDGPDGEHVCYHKGYNVERDNWNALVVTVGIYGRRGRDLLALKAVSEPMLISESATVMRQVTVTAFAGTCNLGSTWPIQLLNGSPLSLAKAQV
jgi:hypothetical protein